MGEIADGLIDGTFDALTGEYLGEGDGFPRTRDRAHAKSGAAQLFREKDGTLRPLDYDSKNYAKGTKAIRKELAILIKKLIAEDIKQPVESARQYINIKYGKGWREQY